MPRILATNPFFYFIGSILVGLTGLLVILAYAFLPVEQSIILEESMKISDSITATIIKGG